MNRIYRTVFNRSLGVFQVAAEGTRSRSKAGRTAGLVGTLLLGAGPALAADLPTGGQIVHGNGTIGSAGNAMVIDQASHKLITNWQSFDIGEGHSVTFNQPNASAVALNRVLGSDGSKIMGTLEANGQVFLVNPNGVLFGQNAQVSVGGLVASTLDIADQDFLAGDYRFQGNGDNAAVTNLGHIQAADGGAVALLGGRVSNEGIIVANLGTVALAAGDAITLDFAGDGLLSVEIDQGLKDALVHNGQLIEADGGRVILSARAAETLVQNLVNQQGIVRARSLENRGGEIVLNGGASGTVLVAGTLDASSETGNGGSIQVTGETIALEGASLDVSGATGGGSIEVGGGYQGGGPLAHAERVSVDAGSTLKADASGTGDGGSIVVWSDGETTAQGRFSARGGAEGGDGGLVETSGKQLELTGIAVDTRAPAGETGTWLIDPDGFTVGEGGDMTGAALTTALQSSNVEIRSTDGSGEGGDIDIDDAVNWSQNTLTLSATNNINVNDVMTATGEAGFVANYGTGTDADGVPYGLYMAQGAREFVGRIDFSGSGTVTLNGTQHTVISDAAGLAAIQADGHYVLGADLGDFRDQSIASFSGNLNGFGHTLAYFNNGNNTGQASGLFGTLEASALVSNLGITSGLINGSADGQAVGSLANVNHGRIANSYTANTINATNAPTVGGLVGVNHGLIANASKFSNITLGAGTTVAGLFVGSNAEDGRILGGSAVDYGISSSTSSLGLRLDATNVSGAEPIYLGGFVGSNAGSIEKSYTNGYVFGGTLSSAPYIAANTRAGGFAGLNTGSIDQSYAYKTVATSSTRTLHYANDKVAGFVYDNYGAITNAYAWRTLSGNARNSAGFVYNNHGTIENAYAWWGAPGTEGLATTVRCGFVCTNEGGLTDVYWSVDRTSLRGTYQDQTAGVTEIAGDAAAYLASYAGFDPTIWTSAYGGFPMLASLSTLYVGSGTATTYGTVSASSIGSLYVYGLQAGDTASAVLYVDDEALDWGYLDAGTYDAAATLASRSGAYELLGTFSVSPLQLSFQNNTFLNKEYDGTATAVFNSALQNGGLGLNLFDNSLVGEQTLDVSWTAAYASENVQRNASGAVTYNQVLVTDILIADGENGGKASNYYFNGDTWSQNSTIAPKALEASDLAAVANGKVYDGSASTTASITSTNYIALGDIAKGSLGFAYDAALFDDANAASGKTVTVSGLGLTGAGAGNYSLATDSLTTSAAIAPRAVTLTGTSSDTGTQQVGADSLALGNLVAGDSVGLSGSASLQSRNLGSNALDIGNLALDNPNYTLVGAVTSFTLGDFSRTVISASDGVSFDQPNDPTRITTTQDKSRIDWQTFSINQGETVEFVQPGSQSIVLNRVLGSNPTLIAGALQSNGRVFILNPNGVLIALGGSVAVGGLLASTLAIGDDDFDNDRFLFTAAGGDGSVVNEGDIVIVDGGFLALASGNGVSSTGSVSASGGKVLLAAADSLTLELNPAGPGLAGYALDALHGTTTVSGRVDVSAANGGGLIETAGQQLVVDETALDTGASGTWSLSLPGIAIGGDEASHGVAFVEEQLAKRSLALNAVGGDLTLGEDLAWVDDTTLGLGASGTIRVNARLAASGERAGLVIDGDYLIDSARLDYDGNPTGHAGAGITLGGANARLVIDGNDYVLLRDMADFAGLDGSGHYALARDIDASLAGTYAGALLPSLSGTLAGLGNVIDRLSIDAGHDSSNVGLVGEATPGSVIRDIGLSNASVAGALQVGTLLGYGDGVQIENAWASGEVNGHTQMSGNLEYGSGAMGGLIGYLLNATVDRAHADVKVTGVYGEWGSAGTLGGLVGGVVASTLTHVYATGDVTGTSSIGGLIGGMGGTGSEAQGATTRLEYAWASGNVYGVPGARVDSSQSTADVDASPARSVGGLVGTVGAQYGNVVLETVRATGDVLGSYAVGGLVGSATSSTGPTTTQRGYAVTINNAEARGNITAYDNSINNSPFIHSTGGRLGGLVGDLSGGGTVSNSSASGDIDVGEGLYSDVGGLVGYNDRGGDISNSSATGSVRGTSNVGGLVGRNYGNITGSWATGNVFASTARAGGLAGWNLGLIERSWASGNVEGWSGTGGLVGTNNESGVIRDSHAYGDVSTQEREGVDGGTVQGSNTGGVAGTNGGLIEDSTASGDVNGAGRSGTLVGYNLGTLSRSTATGSLETNGWESGGGVGENTGTIIDSNWAPPSGGEGNPPPGQDGEEPTRDLPTEVPAAAYQAAVQTAQQSAPRIAFDGNSNPSLELIAARHEGSGSAHGGQGQAEGSTSFSTNIQTIQVDGVLYRLDDEDCAGGDCPAAQ
ncbi:two-partner secretion domain-containing protein [Pseudomonas lopnurensis]|uniref:two-partner secretion domain-containing protein n=1 Tax=Pseudomonas lopnurensis TaxID=1477517 RepID=UPI001879E016|nr:filamentous hemagglutinin N-terminal domain-containing protein [Pseudomonas lopnurensis]MBE7376539.1 filamentous hemagglutinin N-terminal domain-containing protein [Pseudomonas lopnurensis]